MYTTPEALRNAKIGMELQLKRSAPFVVKMKNTRVLVITKLQQHQNIAQREIVIVLVM